MQMLFGSMLAKVKAFCLNSLTIAWGYTLALLGVVLQFIDSVGDILNDPGLKDQVFAAIGDPVWAGRVLLAISIVTLVARLRTIRRQS
jgi:hypothetical protein